MRIGIKPQAVQKGIAKLTSNGRLLEYVQIRNYAAQLYGCWDFSIA